MDTEVSANMDLTNVGVGQLNLTGVTNTAAIITGRDMKDKSTLLAGELENSCSD